MVSADSPESRAALYLKEMPFSTQGRGAYTLILGLFFKVGGLFQSFV